jgi:hypothetical protein
LKVILVGTGVQLKLLKRPNAYIAIKWNLNLLVIIFSTILTPLPENCLYIDIWCLFFIKKISQNLWATIMPFGPVTNIWLAQKNYFGPAGPHFSHWIVFLTFHEIGKRW